MNKISKEQLLSYKGILTVGELKKHIEKYNLSDDARIVIQRVEDVYFDGVDISGMRGCDECCVDGIYPPGSKAEGWSVYLKEGFDYCQALHMNTKMQNEIDSRLAGNEPKFKAENPSKYIVELDDSYMDQYIPASGCAYYYDDSDILFIDLHI